MEPILVLLTREAKIEDENEHSRTGVPWVRDGWAELLRRTCDRQISVIQFGHTSMGGGGVQATGAAAVADQTEPGCDDHAVYLLPMEPGLVEAARIKSVH